MIEIADLRFRWQPAGPDIVDIEAFSLEAGQTCLLQGPSGSGKTSLLNLVGGITLPQSGQIRVVDRDVTAMRAATRDRFRADHIGFIFQLFNLLPYLDLIDNVTLPCRFSAERRRRAIATSKSPETEAARLLDHMGLDIERHGNKPVVQMSVGQQQRVAAARALIGAPELIIADEPTSAVDTETRDSLLALIFGEVKAKGSTLLFVSHDPGLEDRFDRTIDLAQINRAG